jgi:acyl transferase domain-containing protein
MKNPSIYPMVGLGSVGAGIAGNLSDTLQQQQQQHIQQVQQLVQLGLKGSELDQELAKLGITKDYYNAHAKYFEAQSDWLHRRQSGNQSLGMGSVPGAVVQQELDRAEGYRITHGSCRYTRYWGYAIP